MLTYSNAYAEIDLGALADNYKKISEYAHPAQIIAVVKADAYGHGVERCSHTLYNCGCRFFAVATANEALEMRRLFSDCEILILGNTPNVELANILSDNNIIITLGSLEYAKRLEQELSPNKKLRCHIKLDTGMNRIGFSTREEDFGELASVFDVKGLEAAVKESVNSDELTVIIAKAPCALLKGQKFPNKCVVDAEKCKKCGACMKIGCPAMTRASDGTVRIDDTMCNGCGLCMNYCKFGAISKEER